jgi:hypothetical protein
MNQTASRVPDAGGAFARERFWVGRKHLSNRTLDALREGLRRQALWDNPPIFVGCRVSDIWLGYGMGSQRRDGALENGQILAGTPVVICLSG